MVESYTFVDPGSTGTFCTEELMRDLKITGKGSKISLQTLGKEGLVSTHVVKGLEVSGLDEGSFLKLPQVFFTTRYHSKKGEHSTTEQLGQMALFEGGSA